VRIESVRPGTDKLFAKAERAAQTAGAALQGGAPEAAAARAFYAMLYAAKTLLNERGVRLHAHVRIAAALSADDALLRTWLTAAIARRRSGETEVTHADAEELVERARASVDAVRARL
jgi:uncharacterized protein (UPF0332 family)